MRSSAGSGPELLQGASLGSRAALTIHQAIDFARQTAEGLAAAHEQGIVHRDVKPDNLFITSDGRVKILDFGIAKLTRPSGELGGHDGMSTETDVGTVVGTAAYMSPEQIRGETIDPRFDIFSFGAILYEMLAGRLAFVGDTRAETMTAILKEEPSQSLPAGVPPTLARIVWRCLEKGRDARFQSARDLAFALESLSSSGENVAVVSAAVPTASRHWRRVAGGRSHRAADRHGGHGGLAGT